MNPITAPVVRNLSGEKEQLTLKLNKKIYFRSLCKYSRSATNYNIYLSSKWRLNNKSEDG